jgi:enamine deaminase RidA (YjgF/YER057c/UK114 family)
VGDQAAFRGRSAAVPSSPRPSSPSVAGSGAGVLDRGEEFAVPMRNCADALVKLCRVHVIVEFSATPLCTWSQDVVNDVLEPAPAPPPRPRAAVNAADVTGITLRKRCGVARCPQGSRRGAVTLRMRRRPLRPLACLLLLAGCGADPPATPPPVVPEPFHLNAYEQTFGYSQAVKVGRTVYVSGTVAVDAEGRLVAPGDLKRQLQVAYINLAKTLEAHGASFDDVVLERVYTTDMDALLAVADERLHYYTRAQLPATTMVEVRRLIDPGFLVAIEAVVQLPEPPPQKMPPP